MNYHRFFVIIIIIDAFSGLPNILLVELLVYTVLAMRVIILYTVRIYTGTVLYIRAHNYTKHIELSSLTNILLWHKEVQRLNNNK